MPDRRSIVLFAGICATCLAGIVLVSIWVRMPATPVSSELAAGESRLLQQLDSNRLYFRFTAMGPEYGRLAFLDDGTLPASFHPELSCEAVHAAGGRGMCLSADRGVVTTYTAYVFDVSTHEVLGEFLLGGVPSRTRVSPGGRIAASTVFVTGHSYASVDFSTQTMLYDLDSMAPIADLETFEVIQDGETISRADFNFWGVTFLPDGQGFYATLSTAGEHYLVKGDIASQSAVVIRDQVECPSVSPDGTKVAYKRRFDLPGGAVGWHIRVLRLADGELWS